MPGLLNATFGNYTYHVLGTVETVKGILAFMVRCMHACMHAFASYHSLARLAYIPHPSLESKPIPPLNDTHARPARSLGS